jgi:hypothetical protein
MKLKYVGWLLYCATLISCVTTKQTASPEVSVAENSSEDVIVFLVLHIKKDEGTKQNIVKLVSQTKNAGAIKRDKAQELAPSENYLTLHVYEKNQEVNKITVEHPLYKHVEYFEDNQFKTKDIALDESEFFVRIQATNHCDKVVVWETIKNSNPKELTTIKL